MDMSRFNFIRTMLAGTAATGMKLLEAPIKELNVLAQFAEPRSFGPVIGLLNYMDRREYNQLSKISETMDPRYDGLYLDPTPESYNSFIHRPSYVEYKWEEYLEARSEYVQEYGWEAYEAQIKKSIGNLTIKQQFESGNPAQWFAGREIDWWDRYNPFKQQMLQKRIEQAGEYAAEETKQFLASRTNGCSQFMQPENLQQILLNRDDAAVRQALGQYLEGDQVIRDTIQKQAERTIEMLQDYFMESREKYIKAKQERDAKVEETGFSMKVKPGQNDKAETSLHTKKWKEESPRNHAKREAKLREKATTPKAFAEAGDAFWQAKFNSEAVTTASTTPVK